MGRRILLVENNKSDARRIGQFLQGRGHDVTIVADGQQGFDSFTQDPPDLAVIDMLLPKISGSELCLRIRETPEGQATPLVLISSIFRNMQLARIAQERWRVNLFFEKPFDLEDFGVKIEALLSVTPGRRDAAPAETPAADPDLEAAIAEFAGAENPPAPSSPSVEPVTAEAAEAEVEIGTAEEGPEPAAAAPEVRYRTVQRRKEFHLKEVPLSGDLQENSIPEILVYLFYHEESGVLRVESGQAHKTVYVRDGNPVYVESAIREESLGRMLVREGVITEEDCFLSLQNMRTYHKQQGGALVLAGTLTPLQLMAALRRQVRQKVVNLFAWFEGRYVFERKKIKAERATFFEMPVPPIVIEGIATFYEPASIKAIFEEIRQLRLRCKDYFPFRMEDLDLGPDDRRLVDLADGSRTIERIVKESPVDLARTFQVLYALMLLGVFEGILEEQEIVAEREGPVFPDIEFLEEQAERAARGLEELTTGRQPTPADEEPIAISFDDAGTPPAPTPADDSLTEAAKILGDMAPRAALVPDSVDEELDRLAEEVGAASIVVPAAQSSEPEPESATVEPAATGPALEMLAEPQRNAFAELSPEDRALRDRILAEYLALETANHYDVMGLPRKATVDEVKKRYVQLAKTYHADTLGRKFDPGIVQKANEVFARITEAYKTLINAEKRAQYDRRLTESGEEKKERSVAQILVAENHFNRGVELLKKQNFAGAAAEFKKAIGLFPEESEYHTYLGWCTYNLPGGDAAKRFEEARELIQKGIALNPKSDVAFLYLGKILRDRGQTDAAMQAFAQAMKFNRKNLDARNELKALQIERVRQRQAPPAPHKEKPSIKKILTTDLDLETIKKSVLRIFWS